MRLGFLARPSAVGGAHERAVLAAREEERGRGEPEHANRLVDEELDQRLLGGRVCQRARGVAQRLFGSPLIAEEERRSEKLSTRP